MAMLVWRSQRRWSAFVNMTLLYRGLHLAGVYRLTKTTLLFSLKLLISGTVMVA